VAGSNLAGYAIFSELYVDCFAGIQVGAVLRLYLAVSGALSAGIPPCQLLEVLEWVGGG
jgi:hypothetical protein